jgi:hypothetical protein
MNWLIHLDSAKKMPKPAEILNPFTPIKRRHMGDRVDHGAESYLRNASQPVALFASWPASFQEKPTPVTPAVLAVNTMRPLRSHQVLRSYSCITGNGTR